MKSFHFISQLDAMDCGPTCLLMISKFYGKSFDLHDLRQRASINKLGTNLLGLSEAADSLGFKATGVKVTENQLIEDVPLPCILHWKQNHFVVCYDIKKKRNGSVTFLIADPATGFVKYDKNEIRNNWLSTGNSNENEDKGVVLILQPTNVFFDIAEEKQDKKNKIIPFINYLKPYRKHIIQIIVGMVAISILQLVLPFLTQVLVDIGIKDGNLNFIKIILIAQLLIFIARLSVEFIRGWLMLHINTRISISLISDFLIKIMKMPLKFFDTKTIGDILQRINDHKRIESFLTGNSVTLLFSLINFFVFSLVLGYYKFSLLALFFLGNTVYVLYVLFFMKYRKNLDNKKFELSAEEQGNLIQMVSGMQDIKLGNCENQKRWKWEQIQVRLFNINVKNLALGQIQQIGSVFFSQLTNILITFIAAKSVVDGELTLGMMMSVSFILGQLSAPVDQFLGFFQTFQDAKLSLERLNEIHGKNDEEEDSRKKMDQISGKRDIIVSNLSFGYEHSERDFILKDLNLVIQENKVTAIVGASGSGKTTLIKLLLGFYEPQKGSIFIGDTNLNNISPHYWRSCTGSVLQDGYIFSETIAENIALGDTEINSEKLNNAVNIANIKDFIYTLPLRFNTKIGTDGHGLSQGQKQRILIARSVYKNPDFLFFDEATNALDASNEKEIMENLDSFYNGKTVIIVAHRLSTVRNADKIVFIENGQIIEEGNHEALTSLRGKYFNLVKNQLELGN